MAGSYRIKTGHPDLAKLPMHRWGKEGNITEDKSVSRDVHDPVDARAGRGDRFACGCCSWSRSRSRSWSRSTRPWSRRSRGTRRSSPIIRRCSASSRTDCAEMKARYGGLSGELKSIEDAGAEIDHRGADPGRGCRAHDQPCWVCEARAAETRIARRAVAARASRERREGRRLHRARLRREHARRSACASRTRARLHDQGLRGARDVAHSQGPRDGQPHRVASPASERARTSRSRTSRREATTSPS
jgi:hypothetical protein